MNVQDHLWYPYLRYQEECRKAGKEDSVQEFLVITGKVAPPPNSVVVDSVEPIEPAPKKTKRRSRVQKVVSQIKGGIKPKRARNAKGQYIKNDPTTSVNEAWEDGKRPPKKSQRN
jgi:hypothetical protein